MPSPNIAAKLRVWISIPEHRFQSAVWLLVGLLYYPVFKALYSSRWDDIDYSHAYFILPVALFMAWRALNSAREGGRRTAEGVTTGSALYPVLRTPYAVLFIFGLLTFIFGWRQDYTAVSTFSLIPVLYGLIGWLYGPQVVRVLWFPVAYLLLLVPPPLGILDSVTLPMRYGVSIVTEQLVGLLGYPITRDGLLLQIGGHDVFLGEACSGFRSLITLSSLGLAYIFISKCGPGRKLAMTAAIVPLSLLGNLIRVIGVVIVTYYWGESLGQKFFHDASGFVMFVVMLAGLLAIENVVKQKDA
ncbi:MAG: exosortase/archaeosortase family protein [Candidatus Omnitrophota bacterium]